MTACYTCWVSHSCLYISEITTVLLCKAVNGQIYICLGIFFLGHHRGNFNPIYSYELAMWMMHSSPVPLCIGTTRVTLVTLLTLFIIISVSESEIIISHVGGL